MTGGGVYIRARLGKFLYRRIRTYMLVESLPKTVFARCFAFISLKIYRSCLIRLKMFSNNNTCLYSTHNFREIIYMVMNGRRI